MTTEPIHILLVEDDSQNIRTIWNMLHEKNRFQHTAEAVSGVPEALKRLTTGDIDVVVLDLSLVSHQAESDAVQAILNAQPGIALLVITELENEKAGLRALEAGAQDYLFKEEIGFHALVRAVHYAVERQQARTLIREAEEQHRTTTNSLVDYAIIRLDNEGYITDWSKGAEQIFGYPDTDAIGQDFEMLFTEEDRAAGVPEQHLKTAKKQGFARNERWLVHQNGDRFYASGMVRPIYTAKGQVQGFVKIVRDATERLLREELEREKRTLAEGLRDTAADLNSTLKLEEVLEQALNSAQHLVTFDAAVIVLLESGKLTNFHSYGLNPKDQARLERWYRQQMSLDTTPLYQPAAQTGQTIIVQHDSRKALRLPVAFGRSLLVVPLVSKKTILGYLTFINRGRHEFTETDIPKLQAFSTQVIAAIHNALYLLRAQDSAVLHERKQFARNLHDAVVQTLFSASLFIQGFQRKSTYEPQAVSLLLVDVDRLIQGAMAEMRTLLLELRPKNVHQMPFTKLMHQLVTAAQSRTHMEMNLDFEGEPTLPALVHTMLYRIAQEALNNVVKHAQATQLSIILHGGAGYIELRIQDNGRGFATDTPSSGMGLQIIHERAQEINAQLEIQSSVGTGTEISVTWQSKNAPEL